MSLHIPEASAPPSGVSLFLRRWLANPMQMGSIVPSSPALCRRIAAHADWSDGGTVVELGAGTGVVSRALIEAGLPARRLTVVEIVPSMADHLRQVLPGARVIEGDAMDLPRLVRGPRVTTVICGIPMVLLPFAAQRRLIDAMDAVAPGRGFLHFSYCVTSPLSYRRLGLAAERLAWTPLNFPPASVWRYTPV